MIVLLGYWLCVCVCLCDPPLTYVVMVSCGIVFLRLFGFGWMYAYGKSMSEGLGAAFLSSSDLSKLFLEGLCIAWSVEAKRTSLLQYVRYREGIMCPNKKVTLFF